MIPRWVTAALLVVTGFCFERSAQAFCGPNTVYDEKSGECIDMECSLPGSCQGGTGGGTGSSGSSSGDSGIGIGGGSGEPPQTHQQKCEAGLPEGGCVTVQVQGETCEARSGATLPLQGAPIQMCKQNGKVVIKAALNFDFKISSRDLMPPANKLVGPKIKDDKVQKENDKSREIITKAVACAQDFFNKQGLPIQIDTSGATQGAKMSVWNYFYEYEFAPGERAAADAANIGTQGSIVTKRVVTDNFRPEGYRVCDAGEGGGCFNRDVFVPLYDDVLCDMLAHEIGHNTFGFGDDYKAGKCAERGHKDSIMRGRSSIKGKQVSEQNQENVYKACADKVQQGQGN